jgi:uncharacterized protein YndB with AHSA1/START domain
MTVVDAVRDPQALTLTITSQLAAPRERVWQLWSDPRRLELWWGPPGWPATFVEHDLVAGGVSRYFMTGPDGSKGGGWWRVVRVDAPAELEIDDGFGEAPDEAAPDLPVMRMLARLDEADGGTRMTITTRFPSVAAMEQVLAMGMQEGMTLALDQIDALLAAG